MIEVTNEVEIRLTPEVVFEFIANFENAPKWNYFVTDVKKRSSGPIGVGTVFDQTRKTDRQSYRSPTRSLTGGWRSPPPPDRPGIHDALRLRFDARRDPPYRPLATSQRTQPFGRATGGAPDPSRGR